MRDVTPALQAHLDGGVTTLARCWSLTLTDGRVRGFTEHDRDLVFSGVSFRAASGFTASAVEARMGLAVGEAEVAGVLDDEGIDAAELEAGLYDGARVESWMVNWADVDQRVLLGVGEIGEVKRGAAAFTAEIRSLSARLNLAVGRTFQPLCDAALGDARCGVDATDAALRRTGVVEMSVDGRVLTEVRGHGAARIELWRAAARPVEAGDTFTVTAGCDKRLSTCGAKFANVANFRGFPHMPGNDWIAGYPVEGGRNDGGSLNA